MELLSFLWLCSLTIYILIQRSRIRRLQHTIDIMRKQTVPQPRGHSKTIKTESAEQIRPATHTKSETHKPVHVVTPLTPSEQTITTSKSSNQPNPSMKNRFEWEYLIGGKWLNRIGALAIIFAMGFFIKYAFDQNLINETGRVLIGVMVGLLLLGAGYSFQRKKLPIFAQGLVGAGIATLYIAVYAAYNFYHLLPFLVAFLLMCVVTLIAFQQAFQYHSLAVAVLGWVGGYLTPFLLSTTQASSTGLFTYLLLLTVSVLFMIQRRKNWAVLYPLSLHAVYLIFVTYHVLNPDPASIYVRVSWLLVFWILFFLFECWTSKQDLPQIYFSFTLLHFLYVLLIVVNLLKNTNQDLLATLLGGQGLLYLIPVWHWWRQKQLSVTHVIQRYLFAYSGLLLIFIAIGVEWTRYPQLNLWTLMLLLVIWWTSRERVASVFTVASCMLMLNALTLLSQPFQPTWDILINNRFLTGGWMLIVIIYAAHQAKRLTRPLLRHVLYACGSFFLLILSTSELLHSFVQLEKNSPSLDWLTLPYQKYLLVALYWILYAWAMFAVSFWRKIRSLRWIGTFSMIVGSSALFLIVISQSYQPLQLFRPVLNTRFAIFSVALLVFWLLYKQWKSWDSSQRFIPLVFLGLIPLFGLELLTYELIDFFNRQIVLINNHEKIFYFQELKASLILIVWAIYSLYIAWLARKNNHRYLFAFSWVLLLISWIAAVIFGSFIGPIGYFIPILNHRFAMLLVIGIAILILFRWTSDTHWIKQHLRKSTLIVIAMLIVLSFELVTSEVNDFYRQETATNLTNNTQLQYLQNQKQLSLSIGWLLYSLTLLAVGIWRRLQSLRLVSIGIFGISIFKIFIWDLSFLNELNRIISFIGLGVILLLVSYLYQRYRKWFFPKS